MRMEVAGRLHPHAMPRWAGETNFMTTVDESRTLTEEPGDYLEADASPPTVNPFAC